MVWALNWAWSSVDPTRLTPDRLTPRRSICPDNVEIIAPVPERLTPLPLPSEKTVVLLNWAWPNPEPLRFTLSKFTPRRSTCPFREPITAFVPERLAPNVPSEKIVWALNCAPWRFEFERLTPERLTLRKSTPWPNPPPTVEKSILERFALVPERLTPLNPSEKMVWALNWAWLKSIPDKSKEDISCPL